MKKDPPLKIVVVGDIMLDQYISGKIERISPEAPVPVVSATKISSFPGGAANLAMNLSAAGAKVVLFGQKGDDEAGQTLSRLLRDANVRLVPCSYIQNTFVKKRITDQNGVQICRVDFELDTMLKEESENQIIAEVLEELTDADAMVFSDYAKGLLGPWVRKIICGIRARYPELPIFADGKNDPSYFDGAFLIKPNFSELQKWSNKRLSSDEELNAAMLDLGRAHHIDHVVCTLGERGVAHPTKNGIQIYPSLSKTVFDVSGAGDTFLAYLVVTYCSSHSLPEAILIANKASGVAVSKRGTSVVTKAEVFGQGKLPLAEARKGKKVVFTNGCFDILHPGHIQVLSTAKSYGDILVVGLNEDESIRRIKGAKRPINPFEDRKKVLESLAFVDYVIGFDQDTPEELIHSVRPDVLVKGGDYAFDQIVGSDYVLSYGGEVRIVPLLEGFSSTRIIREIAGDNK